MAEGYIEACPRCELNVIRETVTIQADGRDVAVVVGTWEIAPNGHRGGRHGVMRCRRARQLLQQGVPLALGEPQSDDRDMGVVVCCEGELLGLEGEHSPDCPKVRNEVQS